MSNWRAPHCVRGAAGLRATVSIPGSKSVTNRALILAALSTSPSKLHRPLHSRDTQLMVAALRALGISIVERDDDWEITPAPMFGPASVDVGNAGTVMRFMLPVAALATGLIHFDGDPRSHERPIGPLVSALEDLGISIEHGNRYSLPLTINGSGQINGGVVEVDASKSSQFLSALLLAGANMKNGLKVINRGERIPSQPHIDMTLEMLRRFGAQIEVGNDWWQVHHSALVGQVLTIEPDLSNAAPFMAAPLICGGEVIIQDWPKETTQPGDRLREIFSAMGGSIDFVDTGLKITGTGKIAGIEIDLSDEGELTPTIAALAALADSPSILRGIGHLRLHETDRLAALAREINSLGGKVIETEDSLSIEPTVLRVSSEDPLFRTYDDHRMATAGALIGLAVPGLVIENIETTRKTLPDFPALWQSVLSTSKSIRFDQ